MRDGVRPCGRKRCSVIVLKRLSDAIADADRVLAVIRGSAVNQDGHSTVLTAPSGPAQQALIRDALACAQLSPDRIGFVETHGTGTALGDPIEVEAIAATIGQPFPGSGPCLLGSVKANLGHLEAAAGVTGLLKAVLALQHEAVPGQVCYRTLNPHIELRGTRWRRRRLHRRGRQARSHAVRLSALSVSVAPTRTSSSRKRRAFRPWRCADRQHQ